MASGRQGVPGWDQDADSFSVGSPPSCPWRRRGKRSNAFAANCSRRSGLHGHVGCQFWSHPPGRPSPGSTTRPTLYLTAKVPHLSVRQTIEATCFTEIWTVCSSTEVTTGNASALSSSIITYLKRSIFLLQLALETKTLSSPGPLANMEHEVSLIWSWSGWHRAVRPKISGLPPAVGSGRQSTGRRGSMLPLERLCDRLGYRPSRVAPRAEAAGGREPGVCPRFWVAGREMTNMALI
jgi:hypothetical protein